MRCISTGKFPENRKKADITPTFKKGDHLAKPNYRAVSILPTLSKIYEKVKSANISISIISIQNTKVGFVKVIVLDTVVHDGKIKKKLWIRDFVLVFY